ncbi:MAG TPA: nicotinamide mononucleotide transporter family protein [Actinopolymorphaceae bacterium]
MSWLEWLFSAQLQIGDSHILWREIIGNLFGLASAILGMRRSIWTWPVGIVGNILLFTVFLGAVFDTPQAKDLWGQAGRQIFFMAVSIYGMVRWWQSRQRHDAADGGAIVPRWATARERLGLIVAMLGGTAAFYLLLEYYLGSWGPLVEAWILTGSILATYGMARGWVEFWLVWIAVDAVGVPQLLVSGFYPSAVMYLVYAAFVVVGFITWIRVQRRLSTDSSTLEQVPAGDAVG